MGSSLEREKDVAMKRELTQYWIHEKIKGDDEITHEELVQWYQSHLAEFEKPARRAGRS